MPTVQLATDQPAVRSSPPSWRDPAVLGKAGWTLLGLALIAVGAALLRTNPSTVYLGLVVLGLGMVSAERLNALRTIIPPSWIGDGKTLSASTPPAAPNPTTPTVTDPNLDPPSELLGSEEPPSPIDEWYRILRPVLHQASYYTVPTYFLDKNLYIIDWNIAFEMVFAELAGKLRNRHVGRFIAKLDNFDQVLDHGRHFSEQARRGELPLVDIEPLIYTSSTYGRVVLEKLATQLHDASGHLHGWSVALMVREIDWGRFLDDLKAKIQADKLWSVYSASYDRVLLEFPPYHALISDVIAVVPDDARVVADLGAGTGNVTAALVKRARERGADYRVTAVENNLPMLDRLRSKQLDSARVAVVKADLGHLAAFAPESVDAVVMVNVLYAVDDPLECLRVVYRILKPGGVVGLSTTYSETRLDPLLDSIRQHLVKRNSYEKLKDDYQRVHEVNKDIETTIATRHTKEDYLGWIKLVGFEVTKVETTYEKAVILVHARKPL